MNTVSYGVKEWRTAIGDTGIIAHVPVDSDAEITYTTANAVSLQPLSPEVALRALLATPKKN